MLKLIVTDKTCLYEDISEGNKDVGGFDLCACIA